MKPVTASTGPWAGWTLMVLFPACIGIWAGHAGWSSLKVGALNLETRRLADTAHHLIASAQPETLAWRLAEKDQGKSRLRVDPVSETASAAFLLDLARILANRSSPCPEQLASWRRRFGTDFRPEALRQAADSSFPVRWGRHDAWLVWRPEATPTITLSVPPPLRGAIEKDPVR